MLTTNVTRQDRLFFRLKGPKMVSTCEKSISKRVFTSFWLTHISFSLLSFKITEKQAWFWFLCYQTRHQNFDWKHGYFIDFLFSDVLSTVLSLLPCMNIIEKSFMFKIPQILVIMGAVTRQDTNIRFLPSNPWFMIENGWV